MDRILSFCVGILSLVWVPKLLPVGFWLSLFLVLLLLIVVSHAYFKKAKGLIVILSFAVGGVGYGQWHANQHMLSKLTPKFDNTEFIVEGVVSGIVRHEVIHTEKHTNTSHKTQNSHWKANNKPRTRFTFNVTYIERSKQSKDDFFDLLGVKKHYPKRLRLSHFGDNTIAAGQHLRMRVKLRSPRNFANPGSFDHVRMMYSHHIDAYGYVKSKYPVISLGKKQLPILDRFRLNRLSNLSPIFEKLEQGPYLFALLLGDKSNMNEKHKNLLRETGTSHLMAISGLHIAIAAGLGIFLIQRIICLFPYLLLYVPRIYYLAAASLPFAFFYAVLAGLSIPTQRALIMITSVLITQCLQRYIHRWNHLLVALVAVLIWDPLSSLDAGFWFSFIAVALLLYGFSQPANQLLVTKKMPFADKMINAKYLALQAYHYFNGAIKTQWILLIGMPILLLQFNNELPFISPVANFLVVPIVGLFVVPIGILSVVFSFIHHYPTTILLACANAILNIAINILEWLVNYNSLTLAGALPHWSYYQLITVVVLVAILLSRAQIPGYKLAFMCWLVMLLPLKISIRGAFPYLHKSDFVITQLDVGQGSALLISTQTQHWLYDTGGKFSSTFDAGSGIIAPYLKQLNVNRLNGVFISHGDQDHAGGASSLAKAVNVDQWILGGKANNLKLGKKQTPCESGMSWTFDGIQIRIMYPFEKQQNKHLPEGGILKKENDQSCVIQIITDPVENRENTVSNHRAAVLITGDISRKSEYRLIAKYGNELKAQVLVVPHHGSHSSSSKGFLETVAPDRALVSAGFNNRYRHPHPSIVNRYIEQDIELLRSDKLGAIQYRFVNNQWLGPYCHRFRPTHFWQGSNNEEICIGPLSM